MSLSVRFEDKGPVLEPQGSDNAWRVLRPWGFTVREAGHTDLAFIVPTGYTTDLASVPRLPGLYALLGNRGRKAALVHDYLYSCQIERAWADRVFKAGLAHECGPVAQWLMYLGVRVGGGRAWEMAGKTPEGAWTLEGLWREYFPNQR